MLILDIFRVTQVVIQVHLQGYYRRESEECSSVTVLHIFLRMCLLHFSIQNQTLQGIVRNLDDRKCRVCIKLGALRLQCIAPTCCIGCVSACEEFKAFSRA